MRDKRQLVFNSDDFGLSEAVNKAIYEGFSEGLLTSTCLIANGKFFEDAVKNFLPKMKLCGLGVHLNIIEGQTHNKIRDNSLLYDKNGYFNNGFLSILIKSFNKKFMEEVEFEFRTQIERILEYGKPDHINSHVHIHAIPKIFELTCKLAKEYDIPYIRTQYEKFYVVSDIKKYLSVRFYVNIIKLILLNFFTVINRQTLKNYQLDTNESFNGVLYTGFMDKKTILKGLQRSLKTKSKIMEIIVHPSVDKNYSTNYKEYTSIRDKELSDQIRGLDCELVSYKKIRKDVNV